jgi:hypothetical protein
MPLEEPRELPKFRSTSDHNRFPNFREITARFSSVATACNHAIAKGDQIGWNRRTRGTMCAHCWAEWVKENASAEQDEQWLQSQYDATQAGY